ncbi:MAG TPA: sulfatase, partial [Planctomycetaceae bacterium]|nr:sulfatase [Planctomycetaceae bacterium]
AARGVRYTRAFAPAGVCATARSSLIVGMYASSIGSQHMRCTTTLPGFIRPFTTYLRRAGYYCTNQSKQDYNFETPPDAWDVGRGPKAHWKYRKPGQPFFAVFNYPDTHESRIRGPTRIKVSLTKAERHDPADVHVPPYLPDTPLIRKDWARYLDLITMMDKDWIPRRLKELDEAGVGDNTIVFFFSDHGVGLPRAKQFVYEAGLQVPLIIYFPPRWRHLAPVKPGSAVDRLVSFVDFGPTILSLAGVPIPKHIQGKPFLGPKAVPPREYVFGIRDRMDERYDMTRTVRDGRFKYHRNYMPFIPHYPWLDYMEQLATAKELRRLKAEGKLTDGPAFFMADSKPAEELYDLQVDPHELHNLADDPRYQDVLRRMRGVHLRWVRETVDTGFLPEQELRNRVARSSEYEYARSGKYPLERLLNTALLIDRGAEALPELIKRLGDNDAGVRFWAAKGLANLGPKAQPAIDALKGVLTDPSGDVRVAAAQALCRVGRVDWGLPVLVDQLEHGQLWVRVAAADAIDYLGENARPALAALRRAVADTSRENRYIRRVLRHTLRVCGVDAD